VQLTSVYGQMEDYAGSLAVLQVARVGGLLTEDIEVRRLADLLAMNDVPHRCARLLEEAAANERVEKDVELYEKMANCWIAAGEFDKSVQPLEQAANLSEDGQLFVRLGEVHAQSENWAAAAEALEKGIERGGLDDPDHATVLTGIALFKQGIPKRALPWFRTVADSKKHGELARGYIRLIESSAARPLVATKESL
jgi:tetratricopeptide (TPR) repeat protein